MTKYLIYQLDNKTLVAENINSDHSVIYTNDESRAMLFDTEQLAMEMADTTIDADFVGIRPPHKPK